jgi:hypothetical protein
MTKFDEFIKGKKEDVSSYQELSGNYGCQSCELESLNAYFDDKISEIFWICSNGHRSEVKLAN